MEAGQVTADDAREPSRGVPAWVLGLVPLLLIVAAIGAFSALGGRRLYGPVPVDLLAFFDTGVAWTSRDKARFLGGERDRVSSVGFGARVNVLGFLIGEVDYVKPLDRPGRGWIWQWSFTAGILPRAGKS